MMMPKYLLLLALATIFSLNSLFAQDPGPVAKLQTAMQAKDYSTAITAADALPAATEEFAKADAAYLKAVALFLSKKYQETESACAAHVKSFPDSVWNKKVRFLQARALIEQKKHKEAEAIFSAEAERLLSTDRKHRIAMILIKFADDLSAEPDPADLNALPADHARAYSLYNQVLGMEIARELRDDTEFKAARALQLQGNHAMATKAYIKYLKEFDPTWSGAAGSAERLRGRLKKNPPAAGKHRLWARYYLAECEIKCGDWDPANLDTAELVTLLEKEKPAKDAPTLADAHWLHAVSYENKTYEIRVKVYREFLTEHPKHAYAPVASHSIAEILSNASRTEEAIAAYREFADSKNYQFDPATEAAEMKYADTELSLAEQYAAWKKESFFEIGQLFFKQKKYAEAIEQWEAYTVRFPNGEHWSLCQSGIVDARFQIGLDLVSDGKSAEAKTHFEGFLKQYPLEARARQIVFIYGQMAMAEAVELQKDKAEEPKIKAAYNRAIGEWSRLISKYPESQEASLALYRTGMIQSEQLGQLAAAVESFKSLTWGSWSRPAKARLAVMREKSLGLDTLRTYRTNEKATVKVRTRNIEKVTVSQYILSLEDYFRKTHRIDKIDDLDIDLIEPDKTWEVKVADYEKFKPITQDIEVPFVDGKPGVCIVKVSDEDWEATTLIIRSDIDLILKSSKKEAIVYVENRAQKKPAAGVKLLLSDGKKVFAEGVTAEDGVFRTKSKEIADLSSLRVFALSDVGIASNIVSTAQLRSAGGLYNRGVIYTDKPAYQPGETANYRGVIREVKDGSYIVPEKKTYRVQLLTPNRRLLREQEVELDQFGSFDGSAPIPSSAKEGTFHIVAIAKHDEKLRFSGYIQVKQFKIDNLKLAFEFDQDVIFRGERIKGSIAASYYWGSPVSHRTVKYTLPDGRSFSEKTDATGKISIDLDTAGFTPGQQLDFYAQIPATNASARKFVFLANLGFHASVKTDRNNALSGEPVEVTVKTTDPLGEPVGKELTLTVLRSKLETGDRVLGGVPWVERPVSTSFSTVTVEELKVTTDPKTGEGKATIKIEEGGGYILRASGTDRFDQVVNGQAQLYISDDKDATKLRFFAEKSTYEADEIIGHRVIKVKKGFNDLKIPVGHANFPNFRVSVATMDGQRLRGVMRDFSVTRKLNIAIKPSKKTYAPGEIGKVKLVVTDQLGKPVEGQLSLALVNEALYAQFADPAGGYSSTFDSGSRRQVQFAMQSTAYFRYFGVSKKVNKAVQDEQNRIASANREEVELRRIRDMEIGLNPGGGEIGAEVSIGYDSHYIFRGFNYGENLSWAGTAHLSSNDTINSSIGFDESGLPFTTTLEPSFGYDSNAELRYGRDGEPIGGRSLFYQSGGSAGNQVQGGGFAGNMVQGTTDPANYPFVPPGSDVPVGGNSLTAGLRSGGNAIQTNAIDGLVNQIQSNAVDQLTRGESPRQEVPNASRWVSPITTDAAGKATVKLALPDTPAQWRLTARGVTVDTLVAQERSLVHTRKEFFAELRTPNAFQEGDQLDLVARIHNLKDAEGEATVKLEITGGANAFTSTKTIKVGKETTADCIFDRFTVPAGESLRLKVTLNGADLGEDSLVREVPVSPYGLEYADHRGGLVKTETGIELNLPAEPKYASRKLLIGLSPSIDRALIDLANNGATQGRWLDKRAVAFQVRPTVQTAASELLASISAFNYARERKLGEDEIATLRDLAVSRTSALVLTQNSDGGWDWNAGSAGSNWGETVTAYWALQLAKKAGIAMDDTVLPRAEASLVRTLQSLPSDDNEAKAVVLHALAIGGKAEFSAVNRIYRARAELNETALAHMAATLVHVGRQEFAREVLALLEKKAKRAGGRCHWDPNSKRHFFANPREVAAISLWIYAQLSPDSPVAAETAAYLLDRRPSGSAKSLGTVVNGLAAYYAKKAAAGDDYEVAIVVNGKELHRAKSADLKNSEVFAVPVDKINAGKNDVRIVVKGRGEVRYSATLSGFSPDIVDPKSWSYPHVVKRSYFHDRLSYQNVPLDAASSSPAQKLEIGQRVRVSVTVKNGYPSQNYLVWEEPIPAGMMLVSGSVKGSFGRLEVSNSKIRMVYQSGTLEPLTYELVAREPGEFRALPSVIHDAFDRGRMRVGQAATLTILPPGEESDDPYKTNRYEHFELASKHFSDRDFDGAQPHLDALFNNPEHRKIYEKNIARMLLWIHTSREKINAPRVVEMFEILHERHPDLVIPFDKILVVGRAYREIGEFESAWLVFRATIESSFLKDSGVGAVLEDEGQFLGSIDFQKTLWQEYPDSADVVSAYFALSQALFNRAPDAHKLKEQAQRRKAQGKPSDSEVELEKTKMLAQSAAVLRQILTLYPEDLLADDAAFSLVNAFFSLKDYPKVIARAEASVGRFPESEFKSSFQYMAALGHFWQRHYEVALKSAIPVAEGTSKDRDYARYITAQIHHATGDPVKAIEWYQKVKTVYPDASEAIDYFEEKRIAMDEVHTVKPGEKVEVDIRFRNIREAALQVYRVDLMKLYLREKNLSNITKINLAGIDPETELGFKLGDGKDYRDKTHKAELPLKEEGAYLIICRGDDLFTSSLVLVTPLKLEIQEDAESGSVRVNVRSSVKDNYLAEVHVKAIGSNDTEFKSGETDLRGLYEADELTGTATVIARNEGGQYAFYRGKQFLGSPGQSSNNRNRLFKPKPKAKPQLGKKDYLENLDRDNSFLQKKNLDSWDEKRRSSKKGVEVKKAK